MKRFENKVLLIKDEGMLEEIKKLLISKGELICDFEFKLTNKNVNYAQKGEDGEWWLASMWQNGADTELTKEEFINLLNE